MPADQEFWDSVQESRAELAPLVNRAGQYLAKLPRIKHLVKQRDWAACRFQLRDAKFKQRARSLFESRNSEVTGFYKEFAAFCKDVLAAFEELQNILPHAEVEGLKAAANASAVIPQVGLTCRAVQQAAQRLEEFWESRPTTQPPHPDREPRLQQLMTKPQEGWPKRERGPNLALSRERMDLLDQLTGELGTLHHVRNKCSSVTELRARYSGFALWRVLPEGEHAEVLTDDFKPKVWARKLVLRKYGLKSEETLKYDRRKIRKASAAPES